jgi:ligand-binding SRPBCC domain-containing protein
MPLIHLTTFIAAPVQRVFDLARSLKLHKLSMNQYREEMVSGPMHDLAEKNDSITWKARHLFKNRKLQTRITLLEKYTCFIDEQQSGDFRMMKHEHHFKPVDNGVLMIDLFHFETPYGFAGKIINQLFLTNYLSKLLKQRNEVIKNYAETDRWKLVLN